MANWLYNIDIAPALALAANLGEDDEVPDNIKTMICDEVKKAPPIALFASKLKRCKTVAKFNKAMNSLFDEADRSRVWINTF